MAPCQEYLDNGVCTADDCPNDHGLRLCKLCKIWCQGPRNYEEHLKGRRHAAAVKDGRPPPPRLPLFCPDCGGILKHITSATEYDAHLASDLHRKAVRERDGSDRPSSPDAHCAICSLDIFEQDRLAHELSLAHKKKERFAVYQAAFSEAERDKHGVSVDESIDFPFIDVSSGRNSVHARKTVEIKFSSTDALVYLVGARLTSSLNRKSWDPEPSFKVTPVAQPVRLQRMQHHVLYVDFDSEGRGRFEDRLELRFCDYNLNRRFAITRNIGAIVGSREDYEAIKPIAPYMPKTRKATARITELEIEQGPKPQALADVKWVVRLNEYRIPHALEQLISTTKRGQELIKNLRSTWMPRVFSVDTYARFFRTLLHVEEAQLSVDIETFDMDNVALDIAAPGMYRLPVPGLAEKRPSLIVGDRILVQNVGQRSTHWWEGRVFHVRQQEVDLKFNGRFSAYRGQKVNVRFQLNRLVMRRMHQALDSQFAQPRVLFPTEDHFAGCSRPTPLQRAAIRPGERKIAENLHQLEAVAAILLHPAGSPPFIVFGPPGTGKTITIVEAMRQLTLKNTTVRILACAPSNSAADLLAERLARAGLNQRELFRLNAPSRSVDQLPAFLKSYSKTNLAGTFCVPQKEDLCSFRVVVVTCVSASVPHGIGVPRGHFTHVFVDEAGQASEPEAMIAIKTLADSRTNIVLAGDPKQLGPIVHSGAAQALGLQLSLLDRLMARPAYEDDMRGISFVKLTQNFRSHPTILSYPNRQFYRNELEPCGDQVTTHSFIRSSMLVRAGVPIIFENIAGKDLREARSPSFFNIDEASLVKRYVQQLFEDQKMRLVDEHIGVITPYHAQAGKIRTLLKSLPKGNKIKVGSVEEFQGQERRVIIISTVRSSQEHIGYDLRHTLGFVANPRRFNVAVTRAQALLIIVGDASVLSLDPLWRGFLNYVHQVGGWKGRRPDWDVDEPVQLEGATYDRDRRDRAMSDMDAFVERTKEIVMERTRGDADGEIEWDGVVDKEWREGE